MDLKQRLKNNNFLTTGIGSLPFVEVDKGLDYSLLHSLPFLPEFPSLGEDQLMGNLLESEHEGLSAFSERLKKSQIDKVKLQVVGPTTLKYFYQRDSAVDLIKVKIEKLLNILPEDKTYLLFLDEPEFTSDEDFFTLAEWIKDKGLKLGVHCCGRPDWDILLATKKIDIISFDFARSMKRIERSDHFKKYLDQGGELAFGVIPTKSGPPLWDELEVFLDRHNIQSGIVSAACGLAGMSEKRTYEILEHITL